MRMRLAIKMRTISKTTRSDHETECLSYLFAFLRASCWRVQFSCILPLPMRMAEPTVWTSKGMLLSSMDRGTCRSLGDEKVSTAVRGATGCFGCHMAS